MQQYLQTALAVFLAIAITRKDERKYDNDGSNGNHGNGNPPTS